MWARNFRPTGRRPCAVDDGSRVQVRPINQRRVGGARPTQWGNIADASCGLGARGRDVAPERVGVPGASPVRSGTVVRTRRRLR